jgi:hypothetical protein
MKLDPANATRIELLAIRLLFRLHIRSTKLLEFDVKRWFQCDYFPYIRYLFQYWVTNVDKSCYHCHTVEINEMSVFLSSNSCAAVDPPSPLDEATFIT